MSTGAVVRAGRTATWQTLAPAILALAVGLAVWALLFHTEIIRAVAVWNASTAYSHCWFVLPIALYLAWDRRADAAGLPVRPLLWPALLALLGVPCWLFAERIGIMEGRQLVAMGFVELLFLAVLGWRLAWAFSAALLYLFFLVPFGAFLTTDLQRFTAAFTDAGLHVLGIPYFIDQFTIEIPEGTFYVAEACAGLRFLIASIAFGVLYACLIYRSPWRRLAFIAASCVVPVIANGFRALGIVVLGHLLGSAEAGAADHLIYGWIFFSFVILMLILAGLPFRQDRLPPPAPAAVAPLPAGNGASVWLAAAAVMAVAAVGPGVAAVIDLRATTAPAIALPGFAPAPGCTPLDAPAPGVQRYSCDGFTLTARVAVFSVRANPAAVIAARRAATAEDIADETVAEWLTGTTVQPRSWQLVETEKPDRSSASTVWIDGDPSPGGLRGRLRQARNSLFGADFAPVLVTVAVETGGPLDRLQRQRARLLIGNFLDAQGDLNATAVALARAAAP